MNQDRKSTGTKIRTVADLQNALDAQGQAEKVVFMLGDTPLHIRSLSDVTLVKVAGQPDHIVINLYEDRRK